VAYDAQGKERVVVSGVEAGDFVTNHLGEMYVVEAHSGKIWFVGKDGRKQVVETHTTGAKALALTPDQSLLLVACDAPERYLYSFHIQPDGTLAQKQPYFDLAIPYGQTGSGASGMATDTQGRLYVASAAGIQVFDQAGRVIGLLANPGQTPTTHI